MTEGLSYQAEPKMTRKSAGYGSLWATGGERLNEHAHPLDTRNTRLPPTSLTGASRILGHVKRANQAANAVDLRAAHRPDYLAAT
jgi:hypothetical protein